LYKNTALNSFFNVKVDNLGLGDVIGELLLVVDTESNRGGNRISKNTLGKEFYKVQIVSLDEWIKNKNVQHIDLIKMDVEGFEYNVLKGAEKTLEKFHPILFIELDDENLKLQDASAELVIKFLIEKNYVITNSENNESITEKSNFNYCHYDIIAK
jgi:FkbM family methyltransferase